MRNQDINAYFKIIRKWWWVIALLFGVTVGTIVALAIFSGPKYEATVKVQVSAPPPQEDPLYSQFGREGVNSGIAQSQANFTELIQEGESLRMALEAHPEFPMNVNDLREKITIELPEDSLILRVSVIDSNPEYAAVLANSIVEAGISQYGELLAQSTVNTLKFIDQQLETATEDLHDSETALMQFQIENKIGELNGAINSQYNIIRDLRKQSDLILASGDLQKAQAIDSIILDRELELQNMIALSADYNNLKDRVDRARDTYNFLLDRKTEAQIKENQIRSLASIQVITPARAPERPITNINSRIIVFAAIVSLLVGVLLAFFLEYITPEQTLANLPKRIDRSDVVPVPDSSN
ncbi:MAG: hypothetical protein KDJ52_23155 [Anaerolineae bacterium]|nr:hypothetical protein [Anaerolineae bacterium]MCB0212258.1 hypothetical protein [Anaerolineae bacterium]